MIINSELFDCLKYNNTEQCSSSLDLLDWTIQYWYRNLVNI